MQNIEKLVVFDLDGTLNRTELYAVDAALMALSEFGITNFSREDIIRISFGAVMSDALKIFMPNATDEQKKQYLGRYRIYEFELLEKNGRAFDGVVESLTSLKNDGYKIAVCSNASLRYINLVLNTIGLMPFIDYIQPLLPDLTKNDTLKLLLDEVKPQKAVMVGDRIFDHDAAKANGLKFIGCLYGFCAGEMADADVKIESASQIHGAVKSLI